MCVDGNMLLCQSTWMRQNACNILSLLMQYREHCPEHLPCYPANCKQSGPDHDLGHLAYIPTKKRCDSWGYAQARESVVCNTGYRFSVTLLLPPGALRQVYFRSVCHAPLRGHHRPRSKSLHTRFRHSMSRTHRYCVWTCTASVRMLCGPI